MALFASLFLVGGRGHAGDPRLDLDTLEELARALKAADPETVPAALSAGFARVDIGIDVLCQTALADIPGKLPDARALLALHAAAVCHAPYMLAVGRVITTLGHVRAGREIVEAADKAGPADTIFPGGSGTLRDEMEPGHYLLFRHLLGQLRAALVHEGSQRARAIWSDFELLLPGLVPTLVALERAAHPTVNGKPAPGNLVPGNLIPDNLVMDPVRPPRPIQKRAGTPLVAVTGSRIMVNGDTVASVSATGKKVARTDDTIDAGDAAERLKASWTIAGLSSRLASIGKDFRARHPSAPPFRRVVLRPDADVSFKVLKKVVYTCARAGLSAIDYAVPTRDKAFRRIRWSGSSWAPLVLAQTPAPGRLEWDEEPRSKAPLDTKAEQKIPSAPVVPVTTPNEIAADATLTVSLDELVVKGGSVATTTVADAGGRIDEAKLAHALEWLRKKNGPTMALSVGDEVPWRRVLHVMDRAMASGFTELLINAEPKAEAENPEGALVGTLFVEDAGATGPPPTGKQKGEPDEAVGELGGVDLMGTREDKGGSEATRGPLVVAGEAEVHGGLDRERVERTIERHIDELSFCYRKQLDQQPGILGRVVLQFTILGTGAVGMVAQQSSTAKAPEVEHCFAATVRRWIFARPVSGGTVIVVQRFELKP